MLRFLPLFPVKTNNSKYCVYELVNILGPVLESYFKKSKFEASLKKSILKNISERMLLLL